MFSPPMRPRLRFLGSYIIDDLVIFCLDSEPVVNAA